MSWSVRNLVHVDHFCYMNRHLLSLIPEEHDLKVRGILLVVWNMTMICTGSGPDVIRYSS